MKRILLIFNAQNDFVSGSRKNLDADRIVDGIDKMVGAGFYDCIMAVTRTCFEAATERFEDTLEGKKFGVVRVENTEPSKLDDRISKHSDVKICDHESTLDKHLPSMIQYHVGSGMIWDSYTNRGEEYEFHVTGFDASCGMVSSVAFLRSVFPCSKIVVHSDLVSDETEERKNAALVVLESVFCEIESAEKSEESKKENKNE